MLYFDEYKNVKGFVYCDKTPAQDKQLYYAGEDNARLLLQMGVDFVYKNQMDFYKKSPIHHEEYATQCSCIHRGYYCPSPVYDFIIGNVKRGKLLKRRTARSHVTHRYVFSTSEKLNYVEYFNNNKMYQTEYLIYESDGIYGISIYTDGNVCTVSKEIYQGNRIVNFLYVNYYKLGGICLPLKLHQEYFYYDDLGMVACDFQDFDYQTGYIRNNKYKFGRQEGYIVNYVSVNSDGTPIPGSLIYTPGIVRKA